MTHLSLICKSVLAALEFVEEYQKFPVIKPPMIDDRLGGELLRKVEGLYRRVYQVPQDTRLQHVMERWRRTPFRNPGRLIRYAIDHLDQQRPVPQA